MSDGGVAMQESPNMEWIEDKSRLIPSEDKLENLFVSKLGSPSMNEFGQRLSAASVKKLLEERDEMWREHGRSLCTFMEREQERLLRVLHQEIEQLQRKCGDGVLELSNAVTRAGGLADGGMKGIVQGTTTDLNTLQKDLAATKKELASLRETINSSDQKIIAIERRYNDQEHRCRDELDRKNKKLKELNVDLSQKSAVMTQVMTQLHQLRLREAVEKQKRQLGEQQTKRRQMLLTSTRNALGGSWLQGGETDPSDFDSVSLFEAQARQSGIRSLTPSGAVRTSILPPIYTTPLARPASSSFATNIEKPESTKQFRSSFRRSNFRQHSDRE